MSKSNLYTLCSIIREIAANMGRYLFLLILIAGKAVMAEDAQLQIRIDSSGAYLRVELENSLFRAVMRTNQGGECGIEHAIRDWVIKAAGEDQVDNYIDACAQRGPMIRAEMVHDGAERKTLRAEYEDCPQGSGDNSAIIEYSIFPHSPVIRVDYLKYPSSWANTVDIGKPGGTQKGEFRFFGQQEYAAQVRDIVAYPESYWNTYDGGGYRDDPPDGGPLNYENHVIMAVGNPENGRGFGRVMPIFARDERGGVRIVKLLSDQGFETFPRTGQGFAPPFTGYLFVFTEGLDEAVRMGQRIVGGDMLSAAADSWATVSDAALTAENSAIRYGYGLVSFGLKGFGLSAFTNKATGEDHAWVIDASGTGYAAYDTSRPQIVDVVEGDDVLEVQVRTGKTRKVERLYRDLPILEIEYTRMSALWIEDKMLVAGPGDQIAFVMYGMEDIVGRSEGRRLWREAEEACGHNFGDCFIRANGATPEAAQYGKHFIYGMVNLQSGRGVGFVYPTALTIHDWKVWWDEANTISVEFFPQGRLGKRWIFAVEGGREEIMNVGKAIVDGRIGEVASTVVESAGDPVTPDGFALYPNSPNPFNGQTLIRYRIPQRIRVRLEILDALGQNVACLVDQVQEAGVHRIAFRVAGLTSGVYFYRLRAGGVEKTGRMTLVR